MRPHVIDDVLRQARMPYTTFRHPPAFTAQQEAEASHVSGKSWAKGVAFFADDEPIVAIVPAPCRVDPERLRAAAGAAAIRLMPEAMIQKLYPDCEPGALPPVGFSQRVFVDRSLVGDPEMVLSAGTHTDAIQMHFADWAELVRPVISALTCSSS